MRRVDHPDGHRFATCPPLRDAEHSPQLWDALDDDLIQVIATDHAEFTAADSPEPRIRCISVWISLFRDSIWASISATLGPSADDPSSSLRHPPE